MASKYRNIKTHGFDSRAEYARWQELKLLEKARDIYDLKRQVEFVLAVNGREICRYYADFVYKPVKYWVDVTAGPFDGAVVEDVKGVRTAVYRIKKKLMKACYGIDIKEVSAKDLRIRVKR